MDSTLRNTSSLPKGVPSAGMTPMCAHTDKDPVDTARNRLLLLSAMMPALNDASMCDIVITARGARQALYRCHQQQHPLFIGHRHDDASIYDMLLKVQQTPTENNNVEVPPMREPASKTRRKLIQLSKDGTTTSSSRIPSPTAVSSMLLLDDVNGSPPPRQQHQPLKSKAPPSLSHLDLEPRHSSNESARRASLTPLRNTPGIAQILEQSNSLVLSMNNMDERERSVSPPGPDYVTHAVDQHTATMKGSWWSSTDSLSYLYNNPHGSSKEMRRSALKMTNDIRMGWQRPRLVTQLLQAKVEREMAARRKGGRMEAVGRVVANAGGLKTVRALLKICPDPMAVTQEVFHNEEYRNAVLPVVYDTTIWDEEVYFGKVVRAHPTSPVAPSLDTTQNAPFGNSHAVLDCARIKKNNGVRLPTFHTPVVHWGRHRGDDNTTTSSSRPPLTSSTRNKLLAGDNSAPKCIYLADIQDWVENCIVQPFTRPVRLVRGADGVSVRLRTEADGADVVDITEVVDYDTRDSFNALLAEYHTLNDFDDIVPTKGPISLCGQLRAILAGKHLHPSFNHLSDHPYLEGLSSSPRVVMVSHEPTADHNAQGDKDDATPSSPCCISEIAGDLSSLAAIQDIVRSMIRSGKIVSLLTGLDGGALPRIPPLVSPAVPSSLLTNIANRHFADSVCPPPAPGVRVEKGVSKNSVALILLGTPTITRCDVSSEKVWVDLLGPMQRNDALETQRRAAANLMKGNDGVPPVGDAAIPPDEPEAMKFKVDDLSIGLGPLQITLIPYPNLQAANAAKKLLDGYLASSVEAPSSRLDNNRYTSADRHDNASDVDSADEELLAALGGEVDERSGQRPLDVDTPVRRQESNNKNTSFLRRRRPPGRIHTHPKEVDLPYSLAALPKSVLDFLATQPWSTVACTKTGFVDVEDITLSCALRMSIHIGKEGFVRVFNHDDKDEWEEREDVYHRGLRRYCYEKADVADYFESHKPRTDPTIKAKCAAAEKEAAKLIKAKWAECEGYRQKDLINLSNFDISVRSFSNYGALASGAISLLKPILKSIIESELRAMVKSGRFLI